MRPSFISILRLLVLTAGIAGFARAQVTLTFNGTPMASGNGYVAGENYTLVLTVNPNSSPVSGTAPSWSFHLASDRPDLSVPLYASVGGTMVSGTYALPLYESYQFGYDGGTQVFSLGYSPLFNGPLLYVQVLGSGEGLRTADGSAAVDHVEMYLNGPSGLALTRPAGQTANDYLSAYEGTHAIGSGSSFTLRNLGEGGTLYQEFAISTLVIANATSAVPEPSTYALIIGSVVVAWVSLRRRLRGAPDSTLGA